MKRFMVQVQLGSQFADLSVVARDAAAAIAAARERVASDESLRMFRHRFANYVV